MEYQVTIDGQIRTFRSDNSSEAEVEYLDDNPPGDKFYYAYRVSGRHEGPPIEIRMVNPHIDYDEGGYWPTWDSLEYPSGERIDDVVDDFYADVLREDLRITIRETWD